MPRLWNPGNIAIWAFQRIFPQSTLDRRLLAQPEMEVAEEAMESLISSFKDAGGEFLSIDELHGFTPDRDKPYAVLTFDDGYKDNLEFAMPILKRHQVPACIYVITGYPDKQCIHYWGVLHDYLMSAETLSFELNRKQYQYDLNDKQSRQEALIEINRLIEQNFVKVSEVKLFLEDIGVLQKDSDHALTLSWDELRKLDKDPLITIGSHTVNHSNLFRLHDEEVFNELKHSRERLEEELGHEVEHFAFPYGFFGEREVALCRKCNYKTAASVSPGFVGDTMREYLQLPRLWLNSKLDIVTPSLCQPI